MEKEKSFLSVCLLDSPLGGMVAACTPNGLALLEFGGLDHIEKDLKQLCTQTGMDWKLENHPILQQTAKELEAYFAGNLKVFEVRLNPQGNHFALSVWETLLKIPYGTTWSYKQQADIMNNPLAIRAIAATNGRNPIAIIVPCHRVIGSNGQLTGYAGGLDRKKWLLRFELAHIPAGPGALF